jgi:hypothetical protein
MRVVLRSALMLSLILPLSAQWIQYPTAGVPKGKDGKPNLSAPTPRTREGKPDLSGTWLISSGIGDCPKFMQDDRGECAEKIGLSIFGANLNRAIPGGLPYTEWGAAELKRRATQVDPHAKCMPSNIPRMLTLPHYTKFVQVPGLLLLINEFNASYRQIFTDERPLPKDPQPSWNGYSTGKWEGDTLVVQTNGFRDDLWMDMEGTPLTEAAVVTERFRRVNFGKMDIEITINDPKAYTKPWTMKFSHNIVLDTELLDEICLENEKSSQHMPDVK